jgi:hypothetical protein
MSTVPGFPQRKEGGGVKRNKVNTQDIKAAEIEWKLSIKQGNRNFRQLADR